MPKKIPTCPSCKYPIEEPNENAVARGYAPRCVECCRKMKSLKMVIVVNRKQS